MSKPHARHDCPLTFQPRYMKLLLDSIHVALIGLQSHFSQKTEGSEYRGPVEGKFHKKHALNETTIMLSISYDQNVFHDIFKILWLRSKWAYHIRDMGLTTYIT